MTRACEMRISSYPRSLVLEGFDIARLSDQSRASHSGQDHQDQMMLAPMCHHLGKHQRAGRPAARQELVLPGDRIVVAVACGGRDDPLLAGKALRIPLGPDAAVDLMVGLDEFLHARRRRLVVLATECNLAHRAILRGTERRTRVCHRRQHSGVRAEQSGQATRHNRDGTGTLARCRSDPGEAMSQLPSYCPEPVAIILPAGQRLTTRGDW